MWVLITYSSLTRSSLWFRVLYCAITCFNLLPSISQPCGEERGGCMFYYSQSDVDWGRQASVEGWEITPVRSSQATGELEEISDTIFISWSDHDLMWQFFFDKYQFMVPDPFLDLFKLLKSMDEKHTYKQCMASLFLQPIYISLVWSINHQS